MDLNGSTGKNPNFPKHVAVIMDGNGRWAKSKNLPRVEGHRAGAKTVRRVVEESRKQGIRYLTLYAFSSENWQRPKEEVWALMKLFEHYLANEVKLMLDNNIRLRIIGDRTKLSADLQQAVAKAEKDTEHGSAMDLILAISYGGRDELVNAAKRIAEAVSSGKLAVDQIDNHQFQQNLYAPDVPDPDLLIRTSSEYRISNFLLWQLAYTEIVVTDTFWPDFSTNDYLSCLTEYASRTRRYGLTAEQIVEASNE